jgi:hypothetical protein
MPEQPLLHSLRDDTFRVHLGPAPCALDLGDGSERGEYVEQDYVLRLLRRPHRCINLMYCYYPYDEGWPKRASALFKPDKPFAWAYPYDDYFPYQGGPGGNTEGEPFAQMKDVRRHGQDVTLTLAIDCAVQPDHLERIADELAPFGRLRVRINHECDGNWFAYSKRYTHQQIADFFIRFTKILARRAPDVQTICCWGSIDPETGKLRHPDLAPMLEHAHIWALDKYLSLHWAWPYNVCEEDELKTRYTRAGVGAVYRDIEQVYDAFVRASGQRKPFEICEFNADGDVGGGLSAARMLQRFYAKVARDKPRFLRGITYYQFRDRGRLGLEHEDPNCRDVGVATPFLPMYRRLLVEEPYFSPRETWAPLGRAKPTLVWRSAHDADGLGWKVRRPKELSFFELRLPKDDNLLVRVHKSWFYKAPGVEWVDATDAARGAGPTVPVAVFAPPKNGTNPRQGPGFAAETQTRLRSGPGVRVRGAWTVSG